MWIVSPLGVANHFAVLERETDPDEEEYFSVAKGVGIGDREFGFDEEKFFSAQADGEPTSEERRRGDSGPS
eukprot:4768349-Amphidinium_carterae.2